MKTLQTPMSPRELLPDVPADLSDLCMRLLGPTPRCARRGKSWPPPSRVTKRRSARAPNAECDPCSSGESASSTCWGERMSVHARGGASWRTSTARRASGRAPRCGASSAAFGAVDGARCSRGVATSARASRTRPSTGSSNNLVAVLLEMGAAGTAIGPLLPPRIGRAGPGLSCARGGPGDRRARRAAPGARREGAAAPGVGCARRAVGGDRARTTGGPLDRRLAVGRRRQRGVARVARERRALGGAADHRQLPLGGGGEERGGRRLFRDGAPAERDGRSRGRAGRRALACGGRAARVVDARRAPEWIAEPGAGAERRRRSGGVPFFIEELARFVAARGESALDGKASLEDAIAARLRALPPQQRAIVEVVSVADSPVAQSIVFEAAGLEADALPSLLALRSASMVSWTGPGVDDLVSTYHDRIREAVVAALTPEAKRSRHLAIGRALVSRHAVGSSGPWVFDAVRHLGAAGTALSDPGERLRDGEASVASRASGAKGGGVPARVRVLRRRHRAARRGRLGDRVPPRAGAPHGRRRDGLPERELGGARRARGGREGARAHADGPAGRVGGADRRARRTARVHRGRRYRDAGPRAAGRASPARPARGGGRRGLQARPREPDARGTRRPGGDA